MSEDIFQKLGPFHSILYQDMTATHGIPSTVVYKMAIRHIRYSRCAFRHINCFVREKLTRHLSRRSQRAWKPAKDKSVYSHLEKMGLIYL
jgi:hypothetical protein